MNTAQLIGNLTKDPELKITPSGTSCCTFTVATNRNWKTSQGEAKEESEFHRVVAWEKLADLCAQLLKKGERVYISGRIQTKKLQNQDGTERESTEIVASDMIVWGSRPAFGDIESEEGAEKKEEKKAEKKKENPVIVEESIEVTTISVPKANVSTV